MSYVIPGDRGSITVTASTLNELVVQAAESVEGAEASAKIRAGAERDRTVILADARAAAEKLRGEGEAEASRTYAAAYGRDPGFFAAWRTMQAYRAALIGGSTRLVLTPGNDFFKLLQSPPAPAK